MLMNRLQRLGLVLLAVLAAGDLTAPLVTDGEHPPTWVAGLALALGVASLAALPGAWRGSSTALLVLFGTRLVSALLAVPAFFVDDTPVAGVAASGVAVALTVVGVVLGMAGGRRAVTA
jgi:hypothetical protein